MGWRKRFVEYRNGQGITRLSVAFTWHLPRVYQRAVWLKAMGQHVIAGGPAVALMPEYLAGVAEIGGDWDGAVDHHNPQATFTSRGCVRRCPFCAAWRIEGKLRELDDWPVRPIVCDNNLLACSRKHFDRVIDRLKKLEGSIIDFNQGLDARLLTDHHAERLRELNCLARLAFDHIRDETAFMDAYRKLRKVGIPKKRIRIYVLIGYDDSPEDAEYRLTTVRNLKIRPFPMRYNPLDTLQRDSYVGPNWSDRELTRFMRYWGRLNYHNQIPFQEFTVGPKRYREYW